MAEKETVDADFDDGVGLTYGVLQLAGAVLIAPAAGDDAKALARAVLEQAVVEPKKAPAEAETVARAFNREMDIVIDAANLSAGRSTRHERRVMMAEALDRGGMILLDKRIVAQMFAEGCELQLAVERLEQLEAELGAFDRRAGEPLTNQDLSKLVDASFYRDAIDALPNMFPRAGELEGLVTTFDRDDGGHVGFKVDDCVVDVVGGPFLGAMADAGVVRHLSDFMEPDGAETPPDPNVND